MENFEALSDSLLFFLSSDWAASCLFRVGLFDDLSQKDLEIAKKIARSQVVAILHEKDSYYHGSFHSQRISDSYKGFKLEAEKSLTDASRLITKADEFLAFTDADHSVFWGVKAVLLYSKTIIEGKVISEPITENVLDVLRKFLEINNRLVVLQTSSQSIWDVELEAKIGGEGSATKDFYAGVCSGYILFRDASALPELHSEALRKSVWEWFTSTGLSLMGQEELTPQKLEALFVRIRRG